MIHFYKEKCKIVVEDVWFLFSHLYFSHLPNFLIQHSAESYSIFTHFRACQNYQSYIDRWYISTQKQKRRHRKRSRVRVPASPVTPLSHCRHLTSGDLSSPICKDRRGYPCLPALTSMKSKATKFRDSLPPGGKLDSVKGIISNCSRCPQGSCVALTQAHNIEGSGFYVRENIRPYCAPVQARTWDPMRGPEQECWTGRRRRPIGGKNEMSTSEGTASCPGPPAARGQPWHEAEKDKVRTLRETRHMFSDHVFR